MLIQNATLSFVCLTWAITHVTHLRTTIAVEMKKSSSATWPKTLTTCSKCRRRLKTLSTRTTLVKPREELLVNINVLIQEMWVEDYLDYLNQRIGALNHLKWNLAVMILYVLTPTENTASVWTHRTRKVFDMVTKTESLGNQGNLKGSKYLI